MAHCELHYYSEALGKQSTAQVILPEGTHRPPYSVIYLLHGLSDDSSIWLRRTNIERYIANLPIMVVMPDGGRGFYCDAIEGFAHESAITKDLVGFIDRTFQTRADRTGRALCGNSMGGYGAARLAIKNPDIFCTAVSHCGALELGRKTLLDLDVEIARIIGPNPIGTDYDLFALAKKADRTTFPALRLDCGVDDFLLENSRAFHAYLEQLGIPHEYEELPGAHNWDYWDLRVQDAITFFKKHLAI